MPGFPKTTLSLSFVAVLSLFLWGHPSSALMIGYDLTPVGPDAVCFVGAGYPIYKDSRGTLVEYPDYKDSQGNLVAVEPDGTPIMIDPTTEKPLMNKTTGKPQVDTSVGHLTATDTIAISMSCSSVLISPTQVLTAAHCVLPMETDPYMKMKVLCGYKPPTAASQLLSYARSKFSSGTGTTTADQKPRPLSESFKEIYIPASAYIDPKFTVEQAEQGGDSTNDFALINLPRASNIQPLPLLSPLQSINEFLAQPKLPNGKQAFQCAGTGFGLNANNDPTTLQLGLVTDNNMSIQLSFTSGPLGEISTNLDVDAKPLPSDKSDVWYKLAKEQKQATALAEQAAEQAEQAAQQCDKNGAMQAAEEAEYYQEGASQIMWSKLQTLNKWNLINASLMPGDSGGPLLCRDNANSQWKVVGVASVSGVDGEEFDPNQELEVGILNRWVTPNIASVTKKVWPQDASVKYSPPIKGADNLEFNCPAGGTGHGNSNGPSFSIGGDDDNGGGPTGPGQSLGGGQGFSLRGFGSRGGGS